MSMFDPKLKSNSKKKSKPLSFEEFKELEVLRHNLSSPASTFRTYLVRNYLNSKAGQNLEERIFKHLDQA